MTNLSISKQKKFDKLGEVMAKHTFPFDHPDQLHSILDKSIPYSDTGDMPESIVSLWDEMDDWIDGLVDQETDEDLSDEMADEETVKKAGDLPGHPFRGNQYTDSSTVDTLDTTPAYRKALNNFSAAGKEFFKAKDDYRSRKIDDKEFLAAKSKFDGQQKLMDVAEINEAQAQKRIQPLKQKLATMQSRYDEINKKKGMSEEEMGFLSDYRDIQIDIANSGDYSITDD